MIPFLFGLIFCLKDENTERGHRRYSWYSDWDDWKAGRRFGLYLFRRKIPHSIMTAKQLRKLP